MNVRLSRLIWPLIFCACLGGVPVQAQGTGQSAETPLTNSSVVKLVRAGFREKTVLAIIRARPVSFDLAPDRLIELKRNGVSENIILAMLAREEMGPLGGAEGGDGWDADDEAFFRGGNREGGARPQQPGNQDSGELGIFGSSGGSSGRTRSRTGRGGSDDDTQTLGSASVRILRPPVEAGAAGAPKLEKTPTLKNESVVELVEAGFSEGTIIRRIEQSPVEFDLAPEKLAELRKRRVSEQVIAAMRSAMGDEATTSTRPEK